MKIFQKLLLCLCFLMPLSVFPVTKQVTHITPETKIEPLISDLTPAERDAISNKVFKVAITEFPPFIYFNPDPALKNTHFDGISLETLKLISKKIGIKFEFIEYTNIYETIEAVKNGKVDIAFSLNGSNDELSKTIPYFTKKAKIIISRTRKLEWFDIINPETGKNLTMVEIRGTKISDFINTTTVRPKLVIVDTPIEALAKIAFGEVDFGLMDIAQFGYYQEKLESSRLNVVGNEQIFDIDTSFGLSPQLDVNVLNALNKAITSFSVKENEFLNSHWVEFAYEEPLIRPSFAILLFIIAFSTVNNVIWYRFYVNSLRVSERENNRRWLLASTEAIKNERVAAAQKVLEKIHK